jgi:predicted nucleotidyltransferase
LVNVDAELNLRTIASLANVSVAQASRVLPTLTELGIVERREVPPSSLLRFNREHIAAQPLIDLARTRDRTLHALGSIAAELPLPPVSVVVFGSMSRNEADGQSDIDTLVVRPDSIDTEDDLWTESQLQWRMRVHALTGNGVDVLDLSQSEVANCLRSGASLWKQIASDGVVVYGDTLAELAGATNGKAATNKAGYRR